MPQTIRQVLQQDAAALAVKLGLDPDEARREVQYLLQHELGQSRAWLLAHAEEPLTQTQHSGYLILLQRRLTGEPVAYILGEREFYGLNFKVTPDVLIPRPETELLVELALERIAPGRRMQILDLGTGSGAIALALAHARPDVQLTAVDASAGALAIARENATHLNLQNVECILGIWYASLAGRRFDLIVSNPPYVASGDPHLQQGDVRFEPQTALASGGDGLDDIRQIISGAREHLQPGGWLLLEHGYDQAEAVQALLREADMAEVFSAPDLAGIPRVSGGRKTA